MSLNLQSVIIDCWYGQDSLDDLHALDIKLWTLLEDSASGDYDGHELNMDGTDGRLFFYGPNAEALFKAVRPVLAAIPFMQRATATLKFGGMLNAGAPAIEVAVVES